MKDNEEKRDWRRMRTGQMEVEDEEEQENSRQYWGVRKDGGQWEMEGDEEDGQGDVRSLCRLG